jgi:hypothetical protein
MIRRFVVMSCVSLCLFVTPACQVLTSSGDSLSPADVEALYELRQSAREAFLAEDYRKARAFLLQAEEIGPNEEWVEEGLLDVMSLLIEELEAEAEAQRLAGDYAAAVSSLEEIIDVLSQRSVCWLEETFCSDPSAEQIDDLRQRIDGLKQELVVYASERMVDQRAAFDEVGGGLGSSDYVMFVDQGEPAVLARVVSEGVIAVGGGPAAFDSFLSPDLSAGSTWNVLIGEVPSSLGHEPSLGEALELTLLEKGATVLDRSSLDNMEDEISFSFAGDPAGEAALQAALVELAALASSGSTIQLPGVLEALAVLADCLKTDGMFSLLKATSLPPESTPQVGNFHGSQISLHCDYQGEQSEFVQSWDRMGSPVERWERVTEVLPDRSSSDHQFEAESEHSVVVVEPRPVFYDPKMKRFWSYGSVRHSVVMDHSEYVEHMNALIPEPDRHVCERCGNDLGAGDAADPVEYGPGQWKCENEECGLVAPVFYWMGFKPSGELAANAVEATYVTLDFHEAVDGVYELTWPGKVASAAGYFTGEAGLGAEAAVASALEAGDSNSSFVAVKRGESVVLVAREDVELIEEAHAVAPSYVVPSFDQEGSQKYASFEVAPLVDEEAFAEASLQLGVRIVENETSKLLGMMHAGASYRQIQTAPVPVEDWPELQEQSEALLEFLIERISAELPSL